tara:strand:- start:27418 stop:27603 length:186 start_codon:yes stop_codon:yes gene_type:complete
MENLQVENFQDVMRLLDKERVSRTPAYSGYGLEVYQDNDQQIQIIYNCRGDKREVTINRGF